ncbi:MAG: c-type cytochrome [Caldilineaceae bacterium]
MPYSFNYPHRHIVVILVVLVLCLCFVTACGRTQSSGGDGSQSGGSAPLAAPTMPSGQFKAVGEQSILTETVTLSTTAQTTQTTATTPDLARGEAAYSKNGCDACHGANGEGVADKGSALTDMTLTLEEFDALLRTGGGLGNSHIFGRSAVSPSGMEALYEYVQSFE